MGWRKRSISLWSLLRTSSAITIALRWSLPPLSRKARWCMPPERFPPDDPREWLNRARSKRARARAKIPDAYLEDLCFDAQQAAEKAIKAVLLKKGGAFPYVPDLARLLP